LIIDDDPALRRVLERAVLRQGHEPVLASDGDEARALARTESFDVVLMDLRIPGTAGKLLYEAMLADRPELQGCAIVMSGDTQTDNGEEWFGQRGVPVLAKPFDLLELLETIERMAAERAVE
jgi:DNA-binding NtrC family response regulator